MRFGTQLPFAKAAELLTAACGTAVAHDTVRRLTERAGAVWRQLELDAGRAIEATAATPHAPDLALPDREPTAAGQDVLVSLDGAMVPLVGGEWAEVRTLVVGSIAATPHGPTATALSYASRLTSAAGFSPSVLGELTRRGVPDHAGAVVAVSDGAPWIQEVLDLHCPGSIRVLDLMHAVEYLAEAARVAFGPGTQATSEWLAARRSELKAGSLDEVLGHLAELPPADARTDALRYLRARRPMLAYDRFLAAGWPIGSGVVESANKLVVEARLKRSGVHWRREQADALVGLRALDASGRWDAAWPRLAAAWRGAPRRRAPAPEVASPARGVPPRAASPDPGPAPPPPPRPRAKTIVNGRPTADHPWKRGLRPPRPDAPATTR